MIPSMTNLTANLMTQAEAIIVLGVTRPTLYAMIVRGEIKSARLGKRILLHRDTVEACATNRAKVAR